MLPCTLRDENEYVREISISVSFQKDLEAVLLLKSSGRTLVISTSLISNNRLSQSENLVPVLTLKSNNR